MIIRKKEPFSCNVCLKIFLCGLGFYSQNIIIVKSSHQYSPFLCGPSCPPAYINAIVLQCGAPQQSPLLLLRSLHRPRSRPRRE